MIYKNKRANKLMEVSTSDPFKTLELLGSDWDFASYATRVVGTQTMQGPSDGAYLWLSSTEKVAL